MITICKNSNYLFLLCFYKVVVKHQKWYCCLVVSDSWGPMKSSPPGSSLTMRFPRKNTRVYQAFLLQRIPWPRIKITSPALAGRCFSTEPSGSCAWCVHLLQLRNVFLRVVEHWNEIIYIKWDLKTWNVLRSKPSLYIFHFFFSAPSSRNIPNALLYSNRAR